MRAIVPDEKGVMPPALDVEKQDAAILALRDRCLRLGAELPWAERGAILTLLGSAERAFYLINRIVDERQSVSREIAQRASGRRIGRSAACRPRRCRRNADAQRRRVPSRRRRRSLRLPVLRTSRRR